MRAAGTMFAFALAFGSSVLTPSAQAQTFTVLYTFTGTTDGGTPDAGLLRDPSGNLYGTTFSGGANASGTVFELDTTGTETVLYSFTGGADGGSPTARLARDPSGNLYGTTYHGGAYHSGVVFKLNTTGTETVIDSIKAGRDGGVFAGLHRSGTGNLFGTTCAGGTFRLGSVFMLNPAGTETVLYSFMGQADGNCPLSDLFRDPAHTLYGTTSEGGTSGLGTVYMLTKAGQKTVLHNFTGGTDGAYPQVYGGLVQDPAGIFYGTTLAGGASKQGIIFSIDAAGTETILYTFTGGADGGYPYAGLVRDKKGNLYGTTFQGGAFGSGTVFKLSPTGTETVLHSFDYSNDGGYPMAGLVRDLSGNLYGTTSAGGTGNHGTIFKLKP